MYVIELFVLIALIWVVWKTIAKYGFKIGYSMTTVIVTIALFWGFWIQRQDELWVRLRILFGEPFERILVSPMYAAAAGSFLALAYFAITSKFSIQKLRQRDLVPALFASIASIQLFPQSDVMHLWWIAPLCLPFLAQLINIGREKFGKDFSTAIRVTFTAFTVIGFFFALNFIKGPWVEYELPVLKGTYAGAEKVERVDFYGEILNFAKPRFASFDCSDGLYSVADGKYLAADEWYVNWGRAEDSDQQIGEYRFICDQPLAYANLEADKFGMTLISYTEHKLPDYPWSLAILKKD
jgi:hypothetical protein